MSLWTPSGEHSIREEPHTQAPPGGPGAPGDPGDTGTGGPADAGTGGSGEPPDASDVEALRRQLAGAPADVVVANHCYGLFELAAVYLSDAPPRLEQARLAIDALGYVVDGLGERLGEAHPSLRDALAQIRLAFVQISATIGQAPGASGAPGAPGAPGGTADDGSGEPPRGG